MLKSVAAVLKKLCRKEEVIARWGGDEFVILLPQTGAKEAEAICRRVKSSCQEVYVEDVPVSLSLGYACKGSMDKDLSKKIREAENYMYKQKLIESRSSKSGVLDTLLKSLGEKSQETEMHIRRMQKVSRQIAEKMDLSDTELGRLELLVRLHDIGKINISGDILSKEGSLTKEEWEIIKEHPEIGYRIARATEEFSHVAEDILAHHERWDGSGYPRGLKREKISLLARIVAIVDAYDVMSKGRPYKEPMSQEEIVAELKRCAGTQFDPELVEIFLSVLEE
ncbi:MAG: diguanylate cyclase [Tindallia sp. MSAO_Bac2]|nr:MAG: diguanylate cyclase [Tindallia sp. MSAO_Bac2]